jgi:hypothetical protein
MTIAYRFQLSGKGVRHSWQKECPPSVAARYAALVAREYAKDRLYHGTVVRVLDRNGNEVAVIPIPVDASKVR